MQALSILQPYATLIALGIIDIYNTTWSTEFRGRFLIHAGKQDNFFRFFPGAFIHQLNNKTGLELDIHTDLKELQKAPREGIVGIADLTDCTRSHSSPYFEGPYGLVITNARPVHFKPCSNYTDRFFDTPFSEETLTGNPFREVNPWFCSCSLPSCVCP